MTSEYKITTTDIHRKATFGYVNELTVEAVNNWFDHLANTPRFRDFEVISFELDPDHDAADFALSTQGGTALEVFGIERND